MQKIGHKKPSSKENDMSIDLMSTKEMCRYLRIGVSTSHDWRNKKSKRHKPDFPKAIHLTDKSVRFVRQEVIDWAMKQCKEVDNHE